MTLAALPRLNHDKKGINRDMTTHIDWPFMNQLVAASSRCGANLDLILNELDIEVSSSQSNTPLPIERLVTLLTKLSEHSQRGHFPFAFADIFHFDGLPIISTFLASASSLRDAEKLFDWLPFLVHPSIHVKSIDSSEHTQLHVYITDEQQRHINPPVMVEQVMTIIVSLGRRVTQSTPQFLDVSFAHSPLTAVEHYHNFFGCPVRFNQAHNILTVDVDLPAMPQTSAMQTTHARAIEAIRQQLFGGSQAPTLSMQVHDLMQSHPAMLGESIDTIANALRLHPRTLQRRLKEEGKSLSQLLADIRHQMARQLLRDSDLDIDSIAIKLGFTERRSFTQAFKQWQGQAPSAFRRNTDKNASGSGRIR